MALGAKLDELVAEPLMVPFAQVVLGVFLHRVTELPFAQRNHLRRAFRLDRADDPLGISAPIRALRRALDGADSRARQVVRISGAGSIAFSRSIRSIVFRPISKPRSWRAPLIRVQPQLGSPRAMTSIGSSTSADLRGRPGPRFLLPSCFLAISARGQRSGAPGVTRVPISMRFRRPSLFAHSTRRRR